MKPLHLPSVTSGAVMQVFFEYKGMIRRHYRSDFLGILTSLIAVALGAYELAVSVVVPAMVEDDVVSS